MRSPAAVRERRASLGKVSGWSGGKMFKALTTLTVLASAILAGAARAETTDCTEIVSLPATLSLPGIYCFKQDLATSQTSGTAITVAANSVTIDMNGWKLGGLGAGPGTNAYGIEVDNRKNFTLRNGTIRGFFYAVDIDDAGGSTGHIVEDMLLDANVYVGLRVEGSNYQIRRNAITNTVASTNHAVGIAASGKGAVIADNLISTLSGIFAFGSSPRGLSINGLSQSTVERNTVANVTSATTGQGIIVSGSSSNVVLQGNKILELGSTAMVGIHVTNSDMITLLENVVTNAALTASAGISIGAGATNISCVRNLIDGFTTAIQPCTFESGNLTP